MTAPVDWATVEITVRQATPVMPCRSGRHGFHTTDCEDVDALNETLAGLYARQPVHVSQPKAAGSADHG